MRTSASEIRVFRSVRPEWSRKFAVTYLLFRPKLYHQKEVPVRQQTPLTNRVASLRRLYLDDICAEIREEGARKGANSWPTSITFMPVRGNRSLLDHVEFLSAFFWTSRKGPESKRGSLVILIPFLQ